MEGVLWKWTNYWNGWQTRWFVLENGILTYYKSQEEVCKGSKGSIKVHACEIIVHSLDTTRLDLDIPGEQHLYLKAATPQERQEWLVALGSAKACVQLKHKKELSDSFLPNGDVSTDTLKGKKSELRLYCDLLMQQVHMVKTAANDQNGLVLEKLDEATSLLTATCDTFIKTLEDCMKLSSANMLYEPPQHNEVTLPPTNLIPSTRKVSRTVPRQMTNI